MRRRRSPASFTTGTGATTTTSGIVKENPPASATGVPVNAAISLEANAPLDGTTVNGSTFQFYDQTLNSYASGTCSLSPDSMTAYFLSATSPATSRSYTLYFANQEMTGVPGNPLSACCGYLSNYSFTTGFSASATGPTVTGVNPASGLTQVTLNAQITATFSDPVDSLTWGR